jgi:hypothetical protein
VKGSNRRSLQSIYSSPWRESKSRAN